MNIAGISDKIKSCIEDLGYGRMGEKLFEVYSQCNIGDCFKKEYSSLSEFAASQCVPSDLRKSFLDCMDYYQDTCLAYFQKRSTILSIDGSLIGKRFHNQLKFCSEKMFENLNEISKTTKPVIELTSIDNSTYLYIATALGVIAITTYILWKISHRNREQH